MFDVTSRLLDETGSAKSSILGGVPLSGVTRVGLCSGRLKELRRSGDSLAKGWRMLFEDGGDPTGITCQSSGLG